MFSWNDFFINKAGSAAALAIAFTTFLGYFFPLVSPDSRFFTYSWSIMGIHEVFSIGWNQIVAMLIIILVTLINVRGVKFAGWVMTIFTTAKLVALIGLILAAFFSAKGSGANFIPWWPEQRDDCRIRPGNDLRLVGI
jgi:APA family basic amino acid/polyamine antiporter